MDGKVIIGTELDTTEFDKKLESLEKRGESKKIQIELKEKDISATEKKLKSLKDDLIEAENSMGNIAKDAERVAELEFKINELGKPLTEDEQLEYTALTWNNISETESDIIAKTEKLQAEKSKVTAKLETQKQQLEKMRSDYDGITASIEAQKQKINSIKQDQIIDNVGKIKTEVKEIDSNINKAGKSMSGIIGKVKKWGLAVFGIRSAYLFIRQAVSTLSSENEQIATDVQYIKWILAQMLLPVVQAVIKGAYTILGIINSIINAITGINLLAGKSAEAFKKAKKSTAGMSADLKEANKQLAGFDEMNVLQDTTSGGGGGGAETPTTWEAPDFSEYENKFKELKSEWMEFGEEMRTSIEDMPFSVWVDAFGKWALAVQGVTEFVYGLWEIVTGVIQFIKGILEIIVGLITGDTDKIKQGVVDMLDGLWKIIDGVIHAVIGLVKTLVGVVVGVVLTILEKAWELLKGVGQWIYDKIIKPIADFFVGLWNGIINGVKNAVKWVKDIFNSIVGFFSGIINKILSFFWTIGVSVGDAISGAFKGVINGVLYAIENILNFPIRAINKLIDTINNIPGINLGRLSTFSLPRLAKGGIVNMPGPGVMVGNAIAGERGAEGVIPLTDSQQMALLGEAIGKYVTINATIPVYAYNRQVDRQMKRIKAEDGFASNN